MNNLNIETRNYTPHDLTKIGMSLEENRRTNAVRDSTDEDLNTRVFGNNVNISASPESTNIENGKTNSELVSEEDTLPRVIPEQKLYRSVVEGNVNITRPPTAPHFEVRPENSADMFENNLNTRAFEDNFDIVGPPTALGSSNYYYNMVLLQREAEFYSRTLRDLKEKDAEYYKRMSLQEDRRTNAVNFNNSAVPEGNVYPRQIPTENVYPRAFEGNDDITRPAQTLESSNYYYNMKNLQMEFEYYKRAVKDLEEKGYRRKNTVIDCGRPLNSTDPGFAVIPAEYLHPNIYKNNLDIMGPPTAPITNHYNINNLQGETAYTTASMEFGMGLIEEEHRNMNYGLPNLPDLASESDNEVIDICGLSISNTEVKVIESGYIDVCELSRSLTKSELLGYDSVMPHETAENSQHDSSSEYSPDDSDRKVRSPFSPDPKLTSTLEAPRQRIIMLEPYVGTPTTSHKRTQIRGRHLNFHDPNMIYELSDISDDENESDEPPAKRPASEEGITHNEPIAEWVNDIVELYRP